MINSAWEERHESNAKNGLGRFAIAIFALTFGAAARADGPAVKLPLSAFLDTQGTQNIHIPPVADYRGLVAPPPGVKTPAAKLRRNSQQQRSRIRRTGS